MNNTNNALETLVQRDKQIKKANDKLKAELETTTNALSNHASNTEIHTSKEELIQLIVDHLESLDLGITKEVVSVLPTENISDNTLYFVPNEKGYHNEYLYINDKWELVGSTETNFTDYYTKQETDTLLEGKANSVHSHVVSDITDFPTIPTKLSQLENDMGFGSGSGGVITSISWTNITDKPNFSTVATSGSYNDLSNKPTIPNVYNKTLTIQKNGTNVATFTSNSNTDVTADITVPTKVSELSNDSGFITGISWDKVTNKPTLAKVATSGSYTDLSNTPTIPTKVSQLENDMGFGTGGDTSDCVHKSGDETIDGNKFFIQDVNVKNSDVDIAVTPSNNLFSCFRFRGKGNVTTASIQYSQRTYGVNDICFYVSDADSNSHGFRIRTDNRLEPIENNTYSLGASGLKWANVYATTFNGNLKGNADTATSANDPNAVHKTGNETINGVKYFNNLVYLHNNMSNKNSQMDLFTTPANTLYSHYMFVDKNNEVSAYMQYGQQNTGNDFIGLFIHDKDKALHGIQLTTNNEVKPFGNNAYSLGTSDRKWANVYSTNAYINNTYTNRVTTYSITHPSGDNNSYFFMSGGSDYNKGATLYLGGISATNFTPGRFALAARKTDGSSVELAGSPNGTLTWGGKNVAIDENLVHRSGDETINGTKMFTGTIYKKNSALDLQVNPSSNQYNSFLFTDKNNVVMGYLEHLQTTTGVNALGVVARDKNNESHGIQVTSEDNVIPLGNGVVNLGLSGAKWKNVYATTFNGNLSGTIASSTTATTQAISDNSTRIATTAWVRNYVNSVAGSGSVGASISAYYSNATTVTATGDATGTTTGVYPADYSDYINIAPTVGTIYTGSQLFSSFTSTASGTINITYPGPSIIIYHTTASAKATFSGAFSPSAKYLCTTANAVKFRAYVAQGTPSAMGSASVVDQSSSKSIFIRVQ